MRRKTGALGLADKAYIKDNCNKKTVPEMAQVLNRSETSVQKFVDSEALQTRDMDERKSLQNVIRQDLYSKPFWNAIEDQFGEDTGELDYFVRQWVALVESFQEDIKPAEENQLKQFITLDILMNRSMIDRNKYLKEVTELEEKCREQSLKMTISGEEYALLEAQIENARQGLGSFTQEYTKLQERQGKIAQDLKATRDQRVKHVKDSKENWSGLPNRLTDLKEREKMGREAEILRISTQKEKERLTKVHSFIDGTVDVPILNSETVDLLREEDNATENKAEQTDSQ